MGDIVIRRSGTSLSSVHSVSIFIGPRASVENSSNVYCFCNASKFCALIDDALTGSQALSQSQTPLRVVERSEEKKERIIRGMVWLTPLCMEESMCETPS